MILKMHLQEKSKRKIRCETELKLNFEEIPIFTKKVKMSELNPYEKESNLVLNADFYFVEILNQEAISPNDLPVLFEIPVRDFLQLEFCKHCTIETLGRYRKLYIFKYLKILTARRKSMILFLCNFYVEKSR